MKKRGYRIELGEIESVLYHAPNVREVAVLAASDPTTGTTITAFMSFHDALQKPSIIAMKQFCSQRIPIYMIPDTFVFLDEIPHTSTDKTDLETLKEMM